MAKQRITVELDDDTIGPLAAIGDPTEVLTRLANSAADAARRPSISQRDRTDASLRIERAKADAGLAERAGEEDEVVRIARQRADHILQIARGDADREHPPESGAGEARSDRERARADGLLEEERPARMRCSSTSGRSRDATRVAFCRPNAKPPTRI